MNYFEMYDIPVSFSPDQILVKKKFYALSKEFHPDFYINDSEEKQQEILELSTQNNKAYQMLSDDIKRLEYVLHIYGELEEGEKYNLPNDFLMDMMEVNEALMELEFEPDANTFEKIKTDVADLASNLNAELQENFKLFDAANEEDKKAVLKQIKDIYYRQKYLLRIQESIDTFATRL